MQPLIGNNDGEVKNPRPKLLRSEVLYFYLVVQIPLTQVLTIKMFWSQNITVQSDGVIEFTECIATEGL